MRTSALALALALAACSSKSTLPATSTEGSGVPPPSGGGGGDVSDASAPVASTCGFAASPSSYALPAIDGASGIAFAQTGGSFACNVGTNKLTHMLSDMDGDGWPDLVVTSACTDPAVGVTTWLVYRGSSAGFASAAIRFTIPNDSPAPGCFVSVVFDVTGDYMPDYVVTSDCVDATVGTSRWLVYPNVGTGFAATPFSYTLPPGVSAGAFTVTTRPTASCTNGANIPAFEVLDIDGDAKVDFVVTLACDDVSVGTTAWRVYRGTAAGASPTAVPFALPTTPAVTAGAFAATSGTSMCTGVSRPQYGLVDFDADGKLDILATQSCGDALDGATHWLLYRNGGQGFAATPFPVVLPTLPGAPTPTFASLGAVGTCAAGATTPSYALVDGNDDGHLDLLVTRDCADALTGVSYWKLFVNAGASFDPVPRKLALPPALDATVAAPADLAGALQCTGPLRPAFTAAYLGGYKLDLLITAACDDTSVGNTHWQVFPASCP